MSEPTIVTDPVVNPEPPKDTPATPPDWRSMIDEDLRSHGSLADIKDINGLVKSYVHAQSMIGADKIVMPGEDATPEQLNEFFTKLGRPLTAEEYELKYENPPEGLDVDEALQTELGKKMFELGLSKKQAQELFNTYNKYVVDNYTQVQQEAVQARESVVNGLKKEWGAAFDEKLNLAKAAISKLGGDELKTTLETTGLGDNPGVIKMFAKIAEAIGPDRVLGVGAGVPATFTPAEALSKLTGLMSKKDFVQALQDPSNPGHVAAKEEQRKLFQLAYPADTTE